MCQRKDSSSPWEYCDAVLTKGARVPGPLFPSLHAEHTGPFEADRDVLEKNAAYFIDGDSLVVGKITNLTETAVAPIPESEAGKIRRFSSGATRDANKGKFEYHRFLSWDVIEEYAKYMHKHRVMSDGSTREPDNWKQGMPRQTYMDSLARHFEDVAWMVEHKKQGRVRPDIFEYVEIKDALCGILFNTMGMMYEILLGRDKE